MWSDRTKIALGEKVFRNKQFADTFLFLFFSYVNLATVQIWGQTNKFLLRVTTQREFALLPSNLGIVNFEIPFLRERFLYDHSTFF